MLWVSMLFIVATPNLLIAQWVQVNGPESAVVHCLTGYDSVVFAGTSWGGAFISSNSGNSWTPLGPGLMSRSVYSIEVDGTNLFIGTSSGLFHANDTSGPWTIDKSSFPDTGITAIAVDSGCVYASTSSGVFISTDSGSTWKGVHAIPYITCMAVGQVFFSV